MDFENSQTKKNLEAAFAGESQAHTKYRYYSSKAKKDGFVQISNIFMETALNEAEHAKLWFKELHGGDIPSTLENLRDAAAGEGVRSAVEVRGVPSSEARRDRAHASRGGRTRGGDGCSVRARGALRLRARCGPCPG